jgi:uncharacterized membrane protein YhhN
MNEQNGNEKKKGVPMTKEKKFYLFTAIGCALTLTGIILLAVLLPSLGMMFFPIFTIYVTDIYNSKSSKNRK